MAKQIFRGCPVGDPEFRRGSHSRWLGSVAVFNDIIVTCIFVVADAAVSANGGNRGTGRCGGSIGSFVDSVAQLVASSSARNVLVAGSILFASKSGRANLILGCGEARLFLDPAFRQSRGDDLQ